MIGLIVKRFRKVLMVLLVGMLLLGNNNVITAQTVVDDIVEVGTVEELKPWQIRGYDLVIRIGEWSDGQGNYKPGKRVYLTDEIDWKDIPTSIPINKDERGHFIHEHDINTLIATRLYEKCKEKGINVTLQNATNRAEDLNAAGRKSNVNNPKLYLSVHSNSFNSDSEGYFVIYQDPMGKSIANRLANSISNNGLIKQQSNRPNEGSYIGELNTLHNSTCGVLIETGFYSNLNELKKLVSDEYVDYLAEHMSDELVKVLNDFWSK